MPQALYRTDKRPEAPTGFTLLEMMVVLTVSGILTALLLPALFSAKEKSRRVVCKANEEQVLTALHFYANDNDDYLPSAADNVGNYHAIVLSDFTYSQLLDYFGAAECRGNNERALLPKSNQFIRTDRELPGQHGYTIGYGYLATNNLIINARAPFSQVWAQRTTDTSGSIFADANYWNPSVVIAPHRSSGGVVANVGSMNLISPVQPTGSASTASKGPQNSTQAGAVGGNEGFIDGHVDWRSIYSMPASPASSDGSAYMNW